MTNLNVGASYTLTAEIIYNNPLLPPTGVMIFKIGHITLGVSEVINGIATLTISSNQLGIGTFAINVFYAGDHHYEPTEAVVPATIVVVPSTTTMLFLDRTGGGAGSPVMMNAIVFPAISEGTVTFYSTAHNPIAGASNIAVIDGLANVTVLGSDIGTSLQTAFARYNGDATYLPSTSPGVNTSFNF